MTPPCCGGIRAAVDSHHHWTIGGGCGSMDQDIRYALSALLVAASLGVAGTARAYVTVTGDVSPGSPSDPWDLGSSTLRVGGASNPWEPTFTSGEVIVASGGQLFSAGALVGNDRWGTV